MFLAKLDLNNNNNNNTKTNKFSFIPWSFSLFKILKKKKKIRADPEL